MTTPGAVRTKVWKLANKERSKEYMKEYMRKRRAAEQQKKLDRVLPRLNVPPESDG